MKNDGVYSNFFSSGLRAITRRTRKRPTSMFTIPSTSGSNPLSTSGATSSLSSEPTRRMSQDSNISNSAPPYVRSRRSSNVFTLSMSSSQAPSSSQSTTPSRSRRSSLMALPSRVLNRMSISFPIESRSSRRSSIQPQASSGLRHDHTADLTEVVWITEGGPIVPSRLIETTPKLLPIDPFSSSPDTKSVFIDFSDTPTSTPNRESFISFTTSSKSSSLLHLPRRERPTSVQTMPLPPRSRRSSLQYPPPSQDKYDLAWMLDEATPILSPKPGEGLAEVEEADEVDPAQLDWRQFHNDLLREEAAA